MRLLLAIFAVTIVFSSDAFAQSKEIKQLMKDINVEVKAIAAQLENRDTNKDSAEKSLKLRKMFITLFGLVPEVIEKATEEQKPALVRTYERFIGQEVALLADLEENFATDDNEAAKETFTEIGNVKRKAHTIFNP